MVEILADDYVRQQRGVRHALVKRSRRKSGNPEGLTVGILRLKLVLENVLVADDAAYVHLLWNKDKAFGNLGGHLDVVLLVVKLGADMLLLHLKLAGVDRLAHLAVMRLDMDGLVLLGGGLGGLLVQAGLLLGIHLLLEEAAGEFLRLFRKAGPLRLLAEEHLRIFREGLLCSEKLVLKLRVLSSELRILGLQGLHPFLFLGSHFTRSFCM